MVLDHVSLLNSLWLFECEKLDPGIWTSFSPDPDLGSFGLGLGSVSWTSCLEPGHPLRVRTLWVRTPSFVWWFKVLVLVTSSGLLSLHRGKTPTVWIGSWSGPFQVLTERFSENSGLKEPDHFTRTQEHLGHMNMEGWTRVLWTRVHCGPGSSDPGRVF